MKDFFVEIMKNLKELILNFFKRNKKFNSLK